MPEIHLSDGVLWVAHHRATESSYPPLLLSHGAGGSHLDWPAALRRLKDVSLLLPDLPGHGRSSGPGRRVIGDYVDALIRLLDALDVERVVVGGHSMGGAIALTMALNYPGRVAGLILVGTGGRLRVHPDLLYPVLTEPQVVYNKMAGWMWAEQVPVEVRQKGVQRMADTDPQVMHGDLLACDNFDVLDRLGAITAPALVIGGTADLMTPLKYSTRLVEAIPNAELVTIEGGGHMMMLEQPERMVEAVRDWLGRVEFAG